MDILNEFTKEEIIVWIRRNMFLRTPKKSELLYIKWEIMSEKSLKMNRCHTEDLKKINLKQRDEYASQFNLSKDQNERLSLLKKMAPYDQKLNDWLKKSESIRKYGEMVDKIYKSIDAARKIEMTDK